MGGVLQMWLFLWGFFSVYMTVVRGAVYQKFWHNLVPLRGMEGQMVHANEGNNDGWSWKGGG